MATATLAGPSVISFPAAVQIPQPFTQIELELLLSLRGRAAQIETAETSILARLRSGAAVEEGEHTASAKESNRRSVSWREVAERLAIRAFGKRKGELYCPSVLASTKPSPSFSLEVE
jgi:hypothetical protein